MFDMKSHRLVRNFSEIAEFYDVILCDIWGVIHNGGHAYLAACDALMRFRAQGVNAKHVVLLSNAPRPGSAVAETLKKLGVGKGVYDAIITSGDLTRGFVSQNPRQSIFHVGPERDLALYEGLDVKLVDIDEADYIVCTGLFDDERESAENYRGLLEICLRRKLRMVCANPDVAVIRNGHRIECAGAIADIYASLGGQISYFGKPFAEIYESSLRTLVRLDGLVVNRGGRVLAVGDSLATDIAGANRMGMDSLLVARGIHAKEFGLEHGGESMAIDTSWLCGRQPKPTAIIESLIW